MATTIILCTGCGEPFTVATPEEVAAYLVSRGWTAKTDGPRMDIPSSGNLPMFRMYWNEGERRWLEMPLNPSAGDYDERYRELLQRLSAIEHRPFSSIQREIVRPGT